MTQIIPFRVGNAYINLAAVELAALDVEGFATLHMASGVRTEVPLAVWEQAMKVLFPSPNEADRHLFFWLRDRGLVKNQAEFMEWQADTDKFVEKHPDRVWETEDML